MQWTFYPLSKRIFYRCTDGLVFSVWWWYYHSNARNCTNHNCICLFNILTKKLSINVYYLNLKINSPFKFHTQSFFNSFLKFLAIVISSTFIFVWVQNVEVKFFKIITHWFLAYIWLVAQSFQTCWSKITVQMIYSNKDFKPRKEF